MKKVVMSVAVVAAFALASCGGGSPADYADDFCECMTEAIENEDEDKAEECEEIVDEAKEKYDGDEDAEKEFKEALEDCEAFKGMK